MSSNPTAGKVLVKVSMYKTDDWQLRVTKYHARFGSVKRRKYHALQATMTITEVVDLAARLQPHTLVFINNKKFEVNMSGKLILKGVEEI